MFSLTTLLLRALRPAAAPTEQSPPRQLLESACARAGHDAGELRAAASAWLSVIR